jgi:translation initiation factor IF-3
VEAQARPLERRARDERGRDAAEPWRCPIDAKSVRINDRIRSKEVRVIDDDGAQLGIMPPSQALMIAEEKGLDLVEIAAAANPPVCKIMNAGKYFYQQAKRESEARRHQRQILVKEVKFRPKIDEHDYQFKKRNAERFLLDGNKVKSTCIFRGREAVHSEIGRQILQRLAQELAEVALVESSPRLEGNTMIQILGPRKAVEKKTRKSEAVTESHR